MAETIGLSKTTIAHGRDQYKSARGGEAGEKIPLKSSIFLDKIQEYGVENSLNSAISINGKRIRRSGIWH
jgi:hypothetical protein